MDNTLIAPASFQQIDLLRQISELPVSAEQFDSVMVFQLNGCLNVPALSGAIEDLVERHPALRTTIHATESGLRQEVSAGLVHPVMVSQAGETSVAEVVHAAHAARLSPAEAASGTPLFRADIVVLYDTHLLILKVHHLISDGWSDAVMLRDLSEFYRARFDKRSPDLPKLSLTYADFARQQHADWPTLRTRVVEHWATRLDGYAADYVAWPRPAETPDDPYECKVITRNVDTRATRGVCWSARTGRVTPFLVLLAATVMAIGDVTGQYDLLVGSNMANREAFEKRDVIGYFTNTRLMRIHLAADMNVETAATVVREQWLAGDDFRDAYIDQVLATLGRPSVIKIDAFDLLPSLAQVGRLDLPDIMASSVHSSFDSGRFRHWRDLNITWIPDQGGFRNEIRHRLAAVDHETATAIAERTITLVTQLAGKEASI